MLLPAESVSITPGDLWWLATRPGTLLAWTLALAILLARLVRRRPVESWIEQSDEAPILLWALFATHAHFRSYHVICQAAPDPLFPDFGRLLASLGLLSLLFLLAVIGRWRIGSPRPLAFSLAATVAVATVFFDYMITFAVVAVLLRGGG